MVNFSSVGHTDQFHCQNLINEITWPTPTPFLQVYKNLIAAFILIWDRIASWLLPSIWARLKKIDKITIKALITKSLSVFKIFKCIKFQTFQKREKSSDFFEEQHLQ